jgi:hypothetical protein
MHTGKSARSLPRSESGPRIIDAYSSDMMYRTSTSSWKLPSMRCATETYKSPDPDKAIDNFDLTPFPIVHVQGNHRYADHSAHDHAAPDEHQHNDLPPPPLTPTRVDGEHEHDAEGLAGGHGTV